MRKETRKEKSDELQAIIAAELKKFRKKHGFSQEGLARKLQVSVRTYSDLEHGVCLASTMTILTLMAIMSAEEREDFLNASIAPLK